MDIPPIKGSESSILPGDVAEIPQKVEAPELEPFLISFANYSKCECGIDNIDQKRARKALKLLRDVGVGIRSEADFEGFKIKPISAKGDYKKLYKGLPWDIEIKELFIDSDKGRIFYFTVQRILYLVSITDAHYNTH